MYPTPKQIQELSLKMLSLNDVASRLCGRGIFLMSKLKSLTLCDMKFDDDFWAAMCEISPTGSVCLPPFPCLVLHVFVLYYYH